MRASDFLRLHALEQAASAQELEDTEDMAARVGRVSCQVIGEAQVIDQAAGFLRDDQDGAREMLDAAARLVWLQGPTAPGQRLR